MPNIQQKLHISSIDYDCRSYAVKYGLGLEIAEFCWAQHIDKERERHIKNAACQIEGIDNLWFHAPFAELAPCAIDPRARELARLRYRQAIEIAQRLGINCIVIHGGYIPLVYFPETYVEKSICFWREFLQIVPYDFTIALENVMEPDPAMLVEIVSEINDERLGLCLDVGHANCPTSTLPPLEWISPMAPYLKHMHIHNNSGRHDTHNCLDDGTIPIREILDKTLELCPEATFTIENMYCERSLEWLHSQGFLEY